MTGADREPASAAAAGATPRWFARHPGLALLGLNLLVLAVLALVAEVALRLYIPYNPGFYTSVQVRGRDLVYPYGVIKINQDGFPDRDWDLSRPHKVGYFGDSVCYGVGAGYGYRISEILGQAYPQYEHMNISGIGLSIGDGDIRWATNLALRYGMEKVVYLFNLNDIVPDAAVSAGGGEKPGLARLDLLVLEYADWLRGRSYLYTWLRTRAKDALEAMGYGFHGYAASELFPDEQAAVIRQTAQRVNRFADSLRAHGIELIVVLLPYEMQISRQAEQVYAAKGIHWDPSFIGGKTQRIVMETLEPEIRVFDAYHAFVDDADPEASRMRNAVGQYFVYDKGDKLDWNHPNRAGHRAIAEYLIREQILGPEQPAAQAHAAG